MVWTLFPRTLGMEKQLPPCLTNIGSAQSIGCHVPNHIFLSLAALQDRLPQALPATCPITSSVLLTCALVARVVNPMTIEEEASPTHAQLKNIDKRTRREKLGLLGGRDRSHNIDLPLFMTFLLLSLDSALLGVQVSFAFFSGHPNL